MFKRDVFGIFGQVEFAGIKHLILIDECTVLGQVLRAPIFRVEKLLFVPLNPTFDMTM